MPRIHYGNTWWGEKWLNALSDIDFDNRLPRGRTYANRGAVVALEINDNVIGAKVQGRRRSPYKVRVEVPLFTDWDKKAITQIIEKNTLFLSKLLTRQLPNELYDVLEGEGINLFPERWDDLKMKCSCPDWAVPCKHIAAVVYLIANEIDKNPFMVFQLHGMDLLRELGLDRLQEGRGSGVRFKEVSDYLRPAVQNVAKGIPPDIIKTADEIDFTQVPELGENIFSLLTPSPVFYPAKDFARVLRKRYSSVSKASGVRLLEIAEESKKSPQVRELSVFLDRDIGFLRAEALGVGDEALKISGVARGVDKLAQILGEIDNKDLSRYDDSVVSMHLVYNLTLNILQKEAFIPEIIKVDKERFRIHYIPAMFDKGVRDLVEKVSQVVPDDLIKTKSGRGYKSPESDKAVILLFSMFARRLITTSLSEGERDDSVVSFFLQGKVERFNALTTKEIPVSIQMWLSRFAIIQKEYAPVFHVKEKGERFSVEVEVEDKSRGVDEFMKLARVSEFASMVNRVVT